MDSWVLARTRVTSPDAGSHTLLTAALIIAAIGYFLYRQLGVRPVTARALLTPVIVGIVLAARVDSPPGTADIAWILSGAVIGVLLGLTSGIFVRIWRDGATGIVYQRGSWRLVLMLVGLLALRVLIRLVVQHSGVSLSTTVLNDASIAMAIGTAIGRAGLVSLRALALVGGDAGALQEP